MPQPTNLTAEEVIVRLDKYSRRLYVSTRQATTLYATFSSLNGSREWPDQLIGPVASAANTIQHSLLREVVLILVHAFDTARVLATSDRVSFVIVRGLIGQGEVLDSLVKRARERNGPKWADKNERATREAFQRLEERLDRLAQEEPNRAKLLRDYRDEFVGHNLHFEVPRDQPAFRHIKEMLDEIQPLCADCLLAITGHELDFDWVDQEAKEGADLIWSAVAQQPK